MIENAKQNCHMFTPALPRFVTRDISHAAAATNGAPHLLRCSFRSYPGIPPDPHAGKKTPAITFKSIVNASTAPVLMIEGAKGKVHAIVKGAIIQFFTTYSRSIERYSTTTPFRDRVRSII